MRLFIAFLMAASASAAARGDEPPPTTNPPATSTPATNPPATNPPATSTPVTPPPVTPPPATTPPTTAPATNPPDLAELDRSRSEYEAGAKAYERGEYDTALAHFQAAYRAAPSPELFFNIGRCHERLGRWAEAADAYERYLAAKPTVEDAVQIRERISDLKLRAHEAARLAQPATPAPPPPSPPHHGFRVPALALLGVTVALAAGGTGAYFSEWSDYRARRDACAGACTAAEVDALRSRVQTAEIAGGVLWALAGAALVADVVLWIADAHERRERRVAMSHGLEVHF